MEVAKLYFRYGTVGSAKTLNLLAVSHNYRQQGKKILLVKPKIDNRFGEDEIRSRAGLQKKADIILEAKQKLDLKSFENIDCVLVDEAQFLTTDHIDQFRDITMLLDIPVICYGLRTDFKKYLFEGSKRLMELSDSIEEIKATCYFCNKKSIFNLKHINGIAVDTGPSIQLGAEELYYPACCSCYDKQIKPRSSFFCVNKFANT
jgi:thymidine kinase